jgi:hypothetical protein
MQTGRCLKVVDTLRWPAGTPPPATPQLTVPAFTPASQNGYWALGNRYGAQFDDFRVETPVRSTP